MSKNMRKKYHFDKWSNSPAACLKSLDFGLRRRSFKIVRADLVQIWFGVGHNIPTLVTT